MRRWILRSGMALALIGLVAAAGGYAYVRRSLPQHSGEIAVVGLSAPVRIVRDRNSIPHIYAASENDAHFALGFVHAQDRLWQMEMNRRIAAGRLAEFLGAAAVDFDRSLRTLGVYVQAERMFLNLDVKTKTAFEAYASGVNAFLATRDRPLPPEFILLGVTPEPWRPVDSIAWGRMMAWSLSANWREELARFELARTLDARQIGELLPPYPGQARPDHADLGPLYRAVGDAMNTEKLAKLLPDGGAATGSNNWVVAGLRSKTGKPLLANDPHLELTAPAIWYFAHLSSPGLAVIGATLPGAPGVVLGRNDRIAWGFTNTASDSQDLFIERIDPSDAKRYLTPDGSAPFVEQAGIIKVRGGDEVAITIRQTRHGPVISDALEHTGLDPKSGHVLALAWTGLQDDDATPRAFLEMNRARNWPEFVAGLRNFHTPQQSIVYADVEGNIGFIAPARVPLRKAANDLMGLAPAPGWLARYDWDGFAPFESLPYGFNPPDGEFASANDKIVPDDFPILLTHDWQDPFRIKRIREMLGQESHHSVESFAAMQGDVQSALAHDFLPRLLAAPGTDGAPAAKPPKNDAASAARRMLQGWDGYSAADRPEPLIFQAWYRELTRAVYADELGPLFERYWRARAVFMQNVLQDRAGQGRWCDNVTTEPLETCDALIASALGLALEDLSRRYGADMKKWRWGEPHFAKSEHRPLSKVGSQLGGLGKIFEIRKPTPGDSFTINIGHHHISDEAEPYASKHAASMRAIYDLADLDRSVYVHSSGQAGNVFSPAYDDMAERWRKVEYVPMTMAPAAIEADAAAVLILTPSAVPPD
jgi:penicillin amidase